MRARMRRVRPYNFRGGAAYAYGELIPRRLPPGPGKPVARVTGGAISFFTRLGVNYAQVAFTQSGEVDFSDDVPGHLDLGAGGGCGGRLGQYPGGASAGEVISEAVTFPKGRHVVTIGAGAPAQTATGPGLEGSPSSITVDGAAWKQAAGGGAGGGNGQGSGTALTGGSGSNGTTVAARPGTKFSGGASFSGDSDATQRSSGGGAGNSANGLDGTGAHGGDAGAGVELTAIAVPRRVGGGGGGTAALAGVQGVGKDGGTAGSRDPAVPVANAVDCGGSGGAGNGAANGRGGDGLSYYVMNADEVEVIAA